MSQPLDSPVRVLPGSVVFQGDCFAVTLTDRGPDDPHQVFQVWIEDDEVWHYTARASSAWLPELISKLQAAQTWLEVHGVPDGPWGYKR